MTNTPHVLCVGHADSPQFSGRCALLLDAGFRVTELTGRAEPLTPGADAIQPRGLPLGPCWRVTALSRFLHFRALVRALNPDLILAQYAQGLWAWLAPATGRPTAYSVMGGDVLFDEQADPGPIQRAATVAALRRAALVLCKSDYLADRVQAMNPRGEVRVAFWGLDRRTFRPAASPEEKRAERRAANLPEDGLLVLSPRALQPLYNIPAIVRGFAESGLAEEGAHLALCAFRPDPGCEARTRALVDELGLDRAVRFLPPQDPAGMAGLCRAADLGVSVPDSDGLPQSLIEAAGCGLPLILRDLPNYDPELRRIDAALFVAPRRADKPGQDDAAEARLAGELASGMRLLAHDPELRTRLARNADGFVRRREERGGAGRLPRLLREAGTRPGSGPLARTAQALRAAACLWSGPTPASRDGQPVFSGFREYFQALARPLARPGMGRA